ncbi:MAG TPA: restriction endonuclease [candidate division Zixibacteria bacterium]
MKAQNTLWQEALDDWMELFTKYTWMSKDGQQTVLSSILLNGIRKPAKADWDSLKDNSEFSESEPRKLDPVRLPPMPGRPPGKIPKANESSIVDRLSLLDRLIPSRKRLRQQAINRRRELLNLESESARLAAEQDMKALHRDWESECAAIRTNEEKALQQSLREWQNRRAAFILDRTNLNVEIDRRRKNYVKGEPEGVEEFAELVLSRSMYPLCIPRDFDFQYDATNKCLLVNTILPALEDIPRTDSKGKVLFSDRVFLSLYDSVTYQIAIRTLFELFHADEANVIGAIVLSGWVNTYDKATGKPIRPCILSVHASKAEFSTFDLGHVDPKACFKALKGVGSSKLHTMTPIIPIATFDKSDKRFVSPIDVVQGIDELSNLAAMDWEDFEHLVREIFEQEFAQNGGEVKVTRASRDRGVDAIAFDPDPIRGGKIVIQAKRYTRTVDVSAVRDLYGTVLNEGATKGILVTTADYGPDAYEFAKGKPLTLLNGGHLLHLLERHGHKARIDLKEARELNKDEIDPN